jgi:large subunit ribosomal protein L23
MLSKPIISERSMQQAASRRYTFEVGVMDNKTQIAQEVARMFKVTVLDVATSIRHGKVRRVGKKRTPVTRPDRKIAFVTIKPDQKIDLFETNEPEKKV